MNLFMENACHWHIRPKTKHTAVNNSNSYLFIWVLVSLSTHCIGHITTGIVLWTEETSTYRWSRFCTVNCRPTASNYRLSRLRSGQDSNSKLRGGRRECYHSYTVTGTLTNTSPTTQFICQYKSRLCNYHENVWVQTEPIYLQILNIQQSIHKQKTGVSG